MTCLVVEESLLHSIIGSNVLQNVPGEFLVQFPSNETEADGANRNNARDSDQNAPNVIPDIEVLHGVLGLQNGDGLIHLVDLNRGVDHESEVRDAYSDDLNGILDAQSVPYKDELVKKAEDEERKESRDRL